MKSTMPLEYCTMAPGAGHAFRQPGSSQCMHPSLRINHSRLPVSGLSYSVKRINVNISGVKSCGFSYTPTFSSISGVVSFHSIQAVWHALQPMHLDTSISLATLVSWRAGCGTLAVADACTTSVDSKLEAMGCTGGFDAAVRGS